MQKESFEDEIKFLSNPSKDQTLDLVRNLNLFVDKEEIIHSKCRIAKSHVHIEQIINPIILDANHPLTVLIISDCHERCKHLGIASTLNKMRLSAFGVPKSRQ